MYSVYPLPVQIQPSHKNVHIIYVIFLFPVSKEKKNIINKNIVTKKKDTLQFVL